jgi:lipopolysaccharide/colanic/teichoic acid biosynthesis glycosyltransferase
VWLLLAALIKLTSPGPVLYKQERVGRDGQPFMMYKFRSMVADADKHKESLEHLNQADGLLFKIRNDPRVTKVGRLMRKFSVDEFPQLLNVIEGDMSLVGPRPPLPGEVAKYEEWHFRRLQVVPGMTGLWQISGRSDLSFDDAVKLDIYYIENWSPRLDFSILFRTIPVVLLPKGAY